MNQPFSHNPFMIGYGSIAFASDPKRKTKFKRDKLITSTGFASLDTILNNIQSEEQVVLHMGDSSTSGWDSSKVTRTTFNPLAAFFSYKTYSQLLEEQADLTSINAGIPGYTSLQGKRYLKQLLTQLKERNVTPDFVTIYFGNNDGVYNKYEDKSIIGSESLVKSRCRVSVKDYIANLRDMIQTTKDRGSTPILILPPVNYSWKPGLRSKSDATEFGTAIDQLEERTVKRDLITAISYHNQRKYEEAVEQDRVLPRIKQEYRNAMRTVADETSTILIDVQAEVGKESFCDYCHPIESANQSIVDQFFEKTGIQNGRTIPKEIPKDLFLQRTCETIANIPSYISRCTTYFVRQLTKPTKIEIYPQW